MAYRCSPSCSASVTAQRPVRSSRCIGVAPRRHPLKSPTIATWRADGSSKINRTSRNVSRSRSTTESPITVLVATAGEPDIRTPDDSDDTVVIEPIPAASAIPMSE